MGPALVAMAVDRAKGGNASRPGPVPYHEALQSILAATETIDGSHKVAIRDALNRIAAEHVTAGADVPAHRNSAMDGYACRIESLQSDPARLKLVGISAAGSPYQGEVADDECIRVLTGAVVPDCLDTVVMQENCEVHDDRVTFNGKQVADQYIRNAGDDISRGAIAVKAGQTIGVAELGMLASLGKAELSVYRQPVAAFFSTGDELRGIEESLRPGDVYDSNRYTLFGLLTRAGAQPIDLGVVKDDLEQTVATLKNAASYADIIISSAGASVGDHDFVKQAVEILGELSLKRVAVKPGRPLAFGKIGKARFFGLPGNPVSVMVTFEKFVLPALRKMTGATQMNDLTLKARCMRDIKKNPGRLEFQRGILQLDGDGEPQVDTTGDQSSGVLTSMSKANCYIVLPRECGDVTAGTMVSVHPFDVRLP